MFVVSIPLLLITSNIRWAASEVRLYHYSFDRYDAEERTGIARSDLDRAADELVAYFHNDEKDRKSTRLNSSHIPLSRMPSSA